MRTAEETAILLAVLFKRSKQTRARVSQKTIKLLSFRIRLRAAFVSAIADALSQFEICMIELDSGAFGLIPTKSLEAAKAITAKRHMENELPSLVRGKNLDFASLEEEALEGIETPDLED